jgi:hypothetical protein
VSASTKKPAPGSAEPWPAGAAVDEGSFPPVAEFGLRGLDRELDVFDDSDDPRALERHRALMSPEAKRRRARFAKYVGGAVGASLILCAAAVVKTSFAPGPGAEIAKVAPASPAPEIATVAAASRAPEIAAVAAASPTPEVAAVASQVVAPSPPTPAPAASAVEGTAPAPSTTAVAPAGAGATKEREASRFALERGDLGAAIAAGERSVTLDPTDGEAWLVLGAAYQARGDLTQAKRCYRACVDQGRRGPKAECRAMAQGG